MRRTTEPLAWLGMNFFPRFVSLSYRTKTKNAPKHTTLWSVAKWKNYQRFYFISQKRKILIHDILHLVIFFNKGAIIATGPPSSQQKWSNRAAASTKTPPQLSSPQTCKIILEIKGPWDPSKKSQSCGNLFFLQKTQRRKSTRNSVLKTVSRLRWKWDHWSPKREKGHRRIFSKHPPF